MSRGVKVQGDVAIEECTGKNFDLVVCPGVRFQLLLLVVLLYFSYNTTNIIIRLLIPQGMPGAEHLRDSKEVVALLQKQKEDNKLYGAICAAPAVVLHTHGLLPSGPATSYPSFESKMTGVDYKHDKVVVNGKCVTSQGPGTAMAMGVKLVELLCGHETAQSVAQELLSTP